MVDVELLEKKVQESVDIIKARSHISRLLVGLSGGKDSLCLCELIKMAEVTDVKYFNMEFLPNLRIQYELLEYACHRFNIPYEQIIKVPSEHFMRSLKYGNYTWYSEGICKDIPKITRSDIYKSVAKEHQGTVVTGVKKVDSLVMMRKVDKNNGSELYPMKNWKLEDVFAFMKLRKIDIPPLTKRGCRGVGLEDYDMLFIYKNYPDDYQKILEVFPFAGAMVHKYDYFNLKQSLRLA